MIKAGKYKSSTSIKLLIALSIFAILASVVCAAYTACHPKMELGPEDLVCANGEPCKAILAMIVVVSNGWGGVHSETTHIEFDSLEKCLAEARRIKESPTSHFPTPDINAFCIKTE